MIQATYCVVREQLASLWRSRSFRVMWLIALVVTFLPYVNYTFVHPEDYSRALIEANYGQEAMLLAMMLTGLMLVRLGQQRGIIELQASFPRGRTIFSLGQMAAIFILSLAVTAFILVINMICCRIMGIPWEWVGLASKYIILQFLLPLLICGYAGMSAALWIKNWAVFIVVLVFWMIVSSIGNMFISIIGIAMNKPSMFWRQVLNLGIQGNYVVNFNTGLLIEFPRWIVKIAYSAWSILLCYASFADINRSRRMGKRKIPWRSVFALLLAIPMMVGINRNFNDFFYLAQHLFPKGCVYENSL